MRSFHHPSVHTPGMFLKAVDDSPDEECDTTHPVLTAVFWSSCVFHSSKELMYHTSKKMVVVRR